MIASMVEVGTNRRVWTIRISVHGVQVAAVGRAMGASMVGWGRTGRVWTIRTGVHGLQVAAVGRPLSAAMAEMGTTGRVWTIRTGVQGPPTDPRFGTVPGLAREEGCMSWFQGILIGLSLIGTAAQAQRVAAEVRTGVWRAIEVPLIEEKAEPGPVPELRVAPGTATLLKLPVAIIGPDGVKLVGGEGRVDARQVDSKTLVLVTSHEIGPERIPLAVATADGRRYPFLLATRPAVVDLEVRIVFAEETKGEQRDDAVIDALLRREQVFARQYERPKALKDWNKKEGNWETPFVESAVRIGSRYYIQVRNRAREPWKVDQARLEGAGSEVLKVHAIRWAFHSRDEGEDYNVNVIVAEVPEGTGEDFALKTIELVGQDARVASLDQKVNLP